MQRRIQICVAMLCVATCFINTTYAEEDEANAIRLIAANARTSIVEEHEPVIRREAAAMPPALTPNSAEPAAELSGEAGSVSDAAPEPGPAASKPAIEGLLRGAKESDALSDEQRASIVTLLEKSLESLRATDEAKQKRSQFVLEMESVPARLEELQEQLRLPLQDPATPDIESPSLESVDGRLTEVTASLEAARETLKKHQARATELNDSRKQSQQRDKELFEQQAEIEKQLEEAAPEGVSELYLKARESELRTRLERLSAEQRLLKSEVDLAKSLVDFHPLQNDLDRREVARLEEEEQDWQRALSTKRHQESQRQIAEAQRKAREADPALLELAKENAALAESRSKYALKLHQVTVKLREIRESFVTQESSFDKIRKKIDDIGMTEAIGVLLRNHEREMLDDRPIRIRAKEIEDELPQIEFLVIDTHEQREAMWDLDELTAFHAQELLSRHSKVSAYGMVRELLSTRRQYLSDLYADLQTYQTKLADLHIQLLNAVAITAEHKTYIGEHVLWIRSADVVSFADVELSRQGLAELLDPGRWMQVLQDVGVHLQRNLLVWLVILALFTVGLVMSDRLKDRIAAVGESPSVSRAYRFRPSLEVAAESIAVAVFLPGLMFLLSVYLTRFPEASFLGVAICVGLRWTSLMWLGLSVLQQVTRKGGLAEAHFGWHPKNVNVIRQNLGLLTSFGLPAVFTVMLIQSFRDGDYVSSLGRLSFMAGMSVMALFTHRLLDPYRASNGVWAKRDVWLFRIRYVVHVCCVLIPIALTTLAAMGYVYSAHQLAFPAQLSLWLVLGVVLTQAMLGRYLRIARRTAAMRHMQHRRSEKAENQDSDIPIEADIDFQSIDGQVQRLLRGGTVVALVVGISFIWADMVPALKILDRVELWAIQTMPGNPLELRWITLADVLLAAAALFATVMGARNLPGLLNITVFERLPIDYGTRYALTAVTRYAISLVGIILAFQCIGVTWRSVQWLVAAVTVGLGFGLQEIFANFVSGLIIFTERPVRVGDMVTVGTVTGKVTRVQIRATTITDFDRRELVVPNKRFITEDVINWTLSDPITRVVLPVGIAYKCEPELARENLLRVADEHHLVLSEPEPTAIFVGFGDSTLDLELRVFIVGRDNVFLVQNELNLAINRVFKQANLEIAYPQRDLHIRSADVAALAEVVKPRKAA